MDEKPLGPRMMDSRGKGLKTGTQPSRLSQEVGAAPRVSNPGGGGCWRQRGPRSTDSATPLSFH